MTVELIVNERITAKQVKLIIDEKMIGVVAIRDALYRARERGLDLVQVAEGDQPVCRILDADRFRYERAKAEREHARRQRELTIETKEIQLRPVTGEADISMKARRAKEFLEAGDKVKVVMKFKGRENSHRDEGRRIIEQFILEVGDHKIDKGLAEGASDITIVLASNVTKVAKTEKRSKKVKETV